MDWGTGSSGLSTQLLTARGPVDLAVRSPQAISTCLYWPTPVVVPSDLLFVRVSQ